MKAIVRIYDGELSTGAKEILIEALEIDDLLLTGELDVEISEGSFDKGYHELTFEEEVEEAEADVPEGEPG